MWNYFEPIAVLVEQRSYRQALEAASRQPVEFLSRPEVCELDLCFQKIPRDEIRPLPAACITALLLDLRLGRTASARQWHSQLVALRDACKEGSRERAAASQYLCWAGLLMPEIDNAQVLLRLAICCNESGGRYALADPPRLSLTARRPSILRGAKDFSEWGKNYRAVSSIIEPMLTALYGEKGSNIKSAAVAELLYEYNDLNAATVEVAAALSAALPEVVFAGLAQMIRIHQAGGANNQRIEELFHSIDTLISSSGADGLLPAAQALRVRSRMLCGDLEPVREWLKECGLGGVRLCPADSYELITKARALIALGCLRDALGLLEQISLLLRGDFRPLDTIECLTLSAVACELLEERAMALDKLEAALRLASQYRYIRVIADCGPVMLRLLSFLAREPERISGLPERYLRAVGEAAQNCAMLFPRLFDPPREESPSADLTSMELQILRLLEEGHTNRDIGGILGIKLPTVKFHIANLFEKLGARNRTSAVRQAKGLGLLG